MVNWPDDSNRTLVFGRTGSGKSVFAIWFLSTRSFDTKPWIVFDYKGDKLISSIQDLGYEEIDIAKKPPTKPGLYIVRPDVENPSQTNQFLLEVWKQEQTGLFFDEGFMVPQQRPYKAFDHIMTQGRSKEIPVIACYQRPAWLSGFAMASAEYFAVFHLLKPEDKAKANEYVGEYVAPNGDKIDVNYILPKHYCLWYDVNDDQAAILRPCPKPSAILETFDARKPTKKGFWR